MGNTEGSLKKQGARQGDGKSDMTKASPSVSSNTRLMVSHFILKSSQPGDFCGSPTLGLLVRICLPMQGMWVQSLVGERRSHTLGQINPHTTTRKPMCHNC